MLSNHSGSGTVLIHKVTSRIGVFRLVSLFLAISAIPLFRQHLLFKTRHVEPLSLTVRILARHHFPVGRAAAVAENWVFEIIVEVFFFAGN